MLNNPEFPKQIFINEKVFDVEDIYFYDKVRKRELCVTSDVATDKEMYLYRSLVTDPETKEKKKVFLIKEKNDWTVLNINQTIKSWNLLIHGSVL